MKFNGAEHDDFEGTIEEFITFKEIRRQGIAVAVDGEVVPRSKWSEHRLSRDAQVEVVTAAAGG